MLFSSAVRRFWGWWGVLFIANAALMTIELVTARVLAPYLGVSLTSWTSVIAVVMVSMALGAALGAKAVQRGLGVSLVPYTLLLTAGSTALIPVIAGVLGPWVVLQVWPVALSSFALAIATLTIPSGTLAFLYPLIVQSLRREASLAGIMIGKLGAAAALGSIAGVVLSGFVWMMWFSSSVIVSVVSIGMAVLAGLTGRSLFLGTKYTEEKELDSKTLEVISWQWRVSALILGAALMSVEIVASRVIAPFLGVSIFTWTGIIAVILIGVSMGNMLGGTYADRMDGKQNIGSLFVWTAWSVVFALIASTVLGPVLAELTLPLLVRILLLTALAFLPPAVLFGMISPLLVVAATDAKHRLGEVAGTLSAWNTVGGLFGSVGTGFLFIAWIGTRWVLLGVAISLLLVAYLLRATFTRSMLWKQGTAAIVVGAILIFLPSSCITETRYFCIRIQNSGAVAQGDSMRALQLDHLVHSFVDMHHPDRIASYSYEWVYSHVLAYKTTTSTPVSSYFIGGGGFVFPRYILALYPQATSTVSEIDPGVVDFNYRELGLPLSPRLKIFAEDSRQHLLRSAPGQYDLVFGDAFNDLSVPYHLTTKEFHELVKRHMKPDGIYAMNTIDDVEHGSFLAAMIRTLRSVWKHVYVLPGNLGLDRGRNTIVLLATDEPIDLARWHSTVSVATNVQEFSTSTYQQIIKSLSPEEVEQFLESHASPILTDAFAPTDRYLAPLFSEAH